MNPELFQDADGQTFLPGCEPLSVEDHIRIQEAREWREMQDEVARRRGRRLVGGAWVSDNTLFEKPELF